MIPLIAAVYLQTYLSMSFVSKAGQLLYGI